MQKIFWNHPSVQHYIIANNNIIGTCERVDISDTLNYMINGFYELRATLRDAKLNPEKLNYFLNYLNFKNNDSLTFIDVCKKMHGIYLRKGMGYCTEITNITEFGKLMQASIKIEYISVSFEQLNSKNFSEFQKYYNIPG